MNYIVKKLCISFAMGFATTAGSIASKKLLSNDNKKKNSKKKETEPK